MQKTQNIIPYLSRLMGKPTICIGENKDADQLRGNYMDSTIPLLSKSEISSLRQSSMTVQPDLCQTCSETTLLVFPRGGSYLYNKTCRYCHFSHSRHNVCSYFQENQNTQQWTSWKASLTKRRNKQPQNQPPLLPLIPIQQIHRLQ